MLKAVDTDATPLAHDELMKRGNDLVTQAREAAISAIGKSMHPEFVQRGHSLQRRDLLRWREKARDAIKAWREVESTLTELINEIDAADAEIRAGRAVRDDG